MDITMPTPVSFVINKLFNNNHKAYAVGGCIRDSLLSIKPKDWDITTSALPEEVISIFKDYPVIETGLKHGTVTVIIGDMPMEITTFRTEGKYSDNRHPDSVEFVSDLKEDLSRRDFTINSMAYNYDEGLIDLFNGQEDLKRGSIRCVGNAQDRMQEDFLRSLRAIRFACRFNMGVDIQTIFAIVKNVDLIKNISQERIASELNQILLSDHVRNGLRMLADVGLLERIIPEMKLTYSLKQNNPYHKHDVFEHIIDSVSNIEPILHLRLTMFFHDIAKPVALTTGEDGVNHFYGHPAISSDMAVEIMKRMKYDTSTIIKVRELTHFHDCDIPENRKSVKRWLNKIGEENFRDLLKVKRADTMAQSQLSIDSKFQHIINLEIMMEEVLTEKECFSKKDLAINGHDLMNAGYPEGIVIGQIINALVDQVIENPEYNTKEKLLELAESVRGFRRLGGFIDDRSDMTINLTD